MGIPEKLVGKMNGHELFGGEQVTIGAIAIPPGATLYKGYSGGPGAPIIDAVRSKVADGGDGLAGAMPRQQGALALTPQRVMFVKLSKFTSAPKEVLAEWTTEQVERLELGQGSSYPYADIHFSDGTATRVYSEKKGGLDQLVRASERWLGPSVSE